MKLSINVVDQIVIELRLDRDERGNWSMGGIFPVFPDRPGKPHLSVFTRGRRPIHFTANRGRHDQFRRDITDLRPGALRAGLGRLADRVYECHVEQLQPVTLGELDGEEWTVHTFKPDVVARWLRPVCRPGAVLMVDETAVVGFGLHVLRTCISPRALADLTGPAFFIAMRLRRDIVEARSLGHYPDGVFVRDDDGRYEQQHDPGWYWTPPTAMFESIQKHLPSEQFGAAFERVSAYLRRYPRRAPTTQLQDLPTWLGFVWGSYFDAILNVALTLAIHVAESRRK